MPQRSAAAVASTTEADVICANLLRRSQTRSPIFQVDWELFIE